MRKRVVSAFVAVLALGLATPAMAQSSFTGTRMPYDAFDRLPATAIDIDGARLRVAFAPGELGLSRQAIFKWIERSARAVTVYYGRFPVEQARVLVVPVSGRGVTSAQSFGYRGAAIRMMLGSESTEDDLVRDWKAVHEMVHLALPDVDEQHLWLAEGLAVYVESIARVEAGDLTDSKIWGEFARDMPKGLPQAGDKGLDVTHTWGRTYWGGAIYCLKADVEIRKRTGNRLGLQDALRGILAAGGNHEQDWPFERILSVGDAATGTSVLAELYDKMRGDPGTDDLEALWHDLGVSAAGGRATFDGAAPLAQIRKAITRTPQAATPL
jgi:hypothetical protein